MRIQKFKQIDSLLSVCAAGGGGTCEDVAVYLQNLQGEIREHFSVRSMLLYQIYRSKLIDICGDSFKTRIQSFYEDDYLEEQFAADPSNFAIVLALALKKMETGETARARQLLERVASSGFHERKMAREYLAKLSLISAPATSQWIAPC